MLFAVKIKPCSSYLQGKMSVEMMTSITAMVKAIYHQFSTCAE